MCSPRAEIRKPLSTSDPRRQSLLPCCLCQRPKRRRGDPKTVPAASAAGRHCSKLGRQIAVDLEADADLDYGRSRPSHAHFLLL